MNDKDKEAFEKWFKKNSYDYYGYEKNNQEIGWQAACEYMRNKSNPLDALSLYEKLEKEREENKKLIEALEMISEIGYFHDYGDHRTVATNALEKYRGKLC